MTLPDDILLLFIYYASTIYIIIIWIASIQTGSLIAQVEV